MSERSEIDVFAVIGDMAFSDVLAIVQIVATLVIIPAIGAIFTLKSDINRLQLDLHENFVKKSEAHLFMKGATK